MTAGVRTYAPTSAELRAVARALGKRVGQGDWVPVESHQRGSPDDRLLQTMADPFRSVDDVLNRLGEAEVYLRQRSDRRSVFLTVYTEMTATVKRGIESGAFESPGWVRDYLVAFAERYRTALLGAERGELATVPRPDVSPFRPPRAARRCSCRTRCSGSTPTSITTCRTRSVTSESTRTGGRNTGITTESTTPSANWWTSSSA